MKNTQILLAARPVGWPKLSDFRIAATELPDLQDGEALVEAIYLSVDP